MKSKVLILGAGFGGLELATRLQENLADVVDVTLIDRNEFFYFGFSKFDVVFGRKSAEGIKKYFRDLAPSVSFRNEQIEKIEAEGRHVETNAGTYDCDFLVIALGAEMNPDATPGLAEAGYEFYTLEGAEKLSQALPSFDSGTAVIAILGVPYKCPPAPFEAALQLHDFLTARGVRDKTTIKMLTPSPTPLPISRQGSETILRLFAERQIQFIPNAHVISLDPSARVARIKNQAAVPYDLFMGVPVHRVPDVVSKAGVTQEGWISVNSNNLETKYPNVFAIGDVTKIPVGAAMVPKAGAFADRAARTVAAEIAFRLKRRETSVPFDGAGTCYLEFGGGKIARIEANFLGGPAPEVKFSGPSREFRKDKDAFAADRLKRWFKE